MGLGVSGAGLGGLQFRLSRGLRSSGAEVSFYRAQAPDPILL